MTKTKLHAFGAAAALLLWTGAAQAQGGHETASEVQSWCKYIINAKIEADGSFYIDYSQDNGFCWGCVCC
jgi:hypothetical protein